MMHTHAPTPSAQGERALNLVADLLVVLDELGQGERAAIVALIEHSLLEEQPDDARSRPADIPPPEPQQVETTASTSTPAAQPIPKSRGDIEADLRQWLATVQAERDSLSLLLDDALQQRDEWQTSFDKALEALARIPPEFLPPTTPPPTEPWRWRWPWQR